jgi:phosphohistidine phosphatase
VKRVYLLRHGRAEDYDPARHDGDVDRRLTTAGRDECHDVAKQLRKLDEKIEIVLSSPLRRARETADIFAERLGIKVEISSELEQPMAPNRLLQKLRKRQEQRLLLVGHEPGLGQTVATWTGAHLHATPMKKCGIARLDLPGGDDDPVELVWLAPPELFTI